MRAPVDSKRVLSLRWSYERRDLFEPILFSACLAALLPFTAACDPSCPAGTTRQGDFCARPPAMDEAGEGNPTASEANAVASNTPDQTKAAKAPQVSMTPLPAGQGGAGASASMNVAGASAPTASAAGPVSGAGGAGANLGTQRLCPAGQTPTPEICNSIDDNCDGQVDEGCECTNGKEESCVAGKGICAEGVSQCADGKWGPCRAKRQPEKEKCDGMPIDEDCDGAPDNTCACTDGGPARPCPGGNETGECLPGMQMCVNGQWSTCVGSKSPTNEACNGKDDNCNGTVDDAATCPSGQRCAAGTCQTWCTQQSCGLTAASCQTQMCNDATGKCEAGQAVTAHTKCPTGSGVCNGYGSCVPCVDSSDCSDPKQECIPAQGCKQRVAMTWTSGSSDGLVITVNPGFKVKMTGVFGQAVLPGTVSLGECSLQYTPNTGSGTLTCTIAASSQQRRLTLSGPDHDTCAVPGGSGSSLRVGFEDQNQQERGGDPNADCLNPVLTLEAQ